MTTAEIIMSSLAGLSVLVAIFSLLVAIGGAASTFFVSIIGYFIKSKLNDIEKSTDSLKQDFDKKFDSLKRDKEHEHKAIHARITDNHNSFDSALSGLRGDIKELTSQLAKLCGKFESKKK